MKCILTRQKIKLMISEETMQFCKLRRIFQYYVPSKLLSPEKYPHHVLLLFYPFKYQRELLSGFQIARARSAGCCKHKKKKFEPFADLVGLSRKIMRTLCPKYY